MSIKSIRWKKWLTVAVVLGMIAVGPGFLGYQHRNWINTQFHLTGHRFDSGLPHDLVVGNIKIGDSLEDVLKKYPQTHIPGTFGGSFRHVVGPWTWVHYHGVDLGGREMRIEFRAKDDKILEAYMVGSSYFFSVRSLSPVEEADYRFSWDEHYQTRSTLWSFLLGNAARFDDPIDDERIETIQKHPNILGLLVER